MNAGEPHPRIRVLGGEVDVITPTEMLRFVDILTGAGESAVVANHNTHSLFLLRRRPALQAFFDEADLVQIDSTPLSPWARLFGLPFTRRLRSPLRNCREDL